MPAVAAWIGGIILFLAFVFVFFLFPATVASASFIVFLGSKPSLAFLGVHSPSATALFALGLIVTLIASLVYDCCNLEKRGPWWKW